MIAVARSKAATRAPLLSCLLITGALCVGNNSLAESSAEPELCQGHYQTEAEAREQLALFAGSYDTLHGWQQRAERIRTQILRGAELDPLRERVPLRPIFGQRRFYDGYSVENVAFESLRGVFVTGSLYRPRHQTPPFAGILSAHGHWSDENDYGRYRPDAQLRAATLARMGAVVLAWDMVGYGELRDIGWRHEHPKALKQQLWNSVRALDFVSGLGDVDTRRIGITGASGGATQAFLLAAIDSRITVSVPVVQISAHFFGGCDCESGMPIHKRGEHATNNVEIAALTAPRPQLIISNGDDWTHNTPEVEFPYIQNVYRLFGAEQLASNLHLAREGHDYGPSKRNAMYEFMAEHLELSLAEEAGIVIEPQRALFVFGEKQPLPPYAVRDNDSVSWE